MKSISLNLNFAGAILPVIECADGHQRVPMKPVSDIFGLDWKTQKRKISSTAGGQETAESASPGESVPPRKSYIQTLLGVSMEEIFYADQVRPMLCIRLDRVAGFLFTINPELVRARGNEDGAAFLEQKHQEWLDLIHAYECQCGDMFSSASVKKVYAIAKIDRINDPVLKRLALTEIGIDVELAIANASPALKTANGSLF